MSKHQAPQLTTILVIKNEQERIESMFNALLEVPLVHQLILIDDASTDATHDAIVSLLDYHNHPNILYFQNERTLGKGLSLSENASAIAAPVVWAASGFSELDTELLTGAVQALMRGDKVFAWDQGAKLDLNNIPVDVDNHILFKWHQIPAIDRFFNPFEAHIPAFDLALRLNVHQNPARITGWTDKSTSAVVMEQTVAELHRTLQRLGLEEGVADSFKLIKSHLASLIESGKKSLTEDLLEWLNTNFPNDKDLLDLEIRFMEKTGRYVEASELKSRRKSIHEEQASSKVEPAEMPLDELPEPKSSDEDALKREESTALPGGIDLDELPEARVTIVIPTTIDGRPLLQACLASIEEHLSPGVFRVIVVDNSSLDDTFQFLQDLKEQSVFRMEIISNPKNLGFSASVNQALRQTATPYVLVMHNDVMLESDILSPMLEFLDQNPEAGAISASSGYSWNQLQLDSQKSGSGVKEVAYLDAYCMMFRREPKFIFDERFGLAFFEDVDFSEMLRENNYKVMVLTEHSVNHLGAMTTRELGLELNGPEYFKNLSLFDEKWGRGVDLPEHLNEASSTNQLLAIAEIINPIVPEAHLVNKILDLLTDEVQTQILKSSWEAPQLESFLRVMMSVERRDLLRTLEDRVKLEDLSEHVVLDLIRFYFARNIYSRCLNYIGFYNTLEEAPLEIQLLRLRIYFADRNIDKSIELASKLLEQIPTHPELLKVNADLHAFLGNKEMSEQFYSIAHIINPALYPEDQYLIDESR